MFQSGNTGWNAPVQVPSNPAIQFFEYNGNVEWQKCQSPANLRWLYQHCPPLSAVISQKAEAFATGNLEVLNANTGNFVRGQYKQWDALFDMPNPIQSKKQFLKQLYSYVQLYGYCVVLKNYPAGFKDIPSSMWCIPAEMLYFEPINKPFFQITKEEMVNRIWLEWDGRRIKLNASDIMMIADSSALIDPNTLLPQSRVTNLEKPISIVLSSLEAEITMIQKRGALGIFANRATDISGTVPLLKDEKDQLQRDLGGYGLSRSMNQYIVTNANLDWVPVSVATRELMLHESYIKSSKDIYEMFGYPYPLSAHSDQSTFNNITNSGITLYQNTIIPEAQNIAEQLERGLNAVEQRIEFVFNYDDNPALQKSEKEKGEGQKAVSDANKIAWEAGLITLNDWREELDMDRLPGEEFNMYKPEYDAWFKSKYAQQNIVTNEPTTQEPI